MKRIIVTMMAAMLICATAMAQDEKKEQRQPRKFDKTEMVKHRTDETVSRYKLNDKQAKQLLELNTKYADKMGPRGPHHPGHHGAGRPPMPPKDAKSERPEPPKDDAKMKDHKKQGEKHHKEMEKRRKEMEETMKAYDAEIKKIMTADQYKTYQADQQKMRGKHHGPRNNEQKENK